MKKIKLDKNYYYILIITIIITTHFFSNKYIMGDDTLYHLSNIDFLTKDLINLNFTKISSSILNGLGYGGSIFYPKLPHFSASIINIFIKDSVLSIKIIEIIIIFLSGIFMYELSKKIYINKYISILSSTLYITSTYLIRNIYLRNSYNELFIYLFVPIIFLSLEYLKENNNKLFIILFSIGYIGMINSHLIMTIYFTFLLIIYLLLNYKIFLNKNNINSFIKASIIILIICLPGLILMLEHKNTSLYVVFQKEEMYSLDCIKESSLNLLNYIIPNISKAEYHFLNIVELLGIVLSTIYLFLDKNKKRTSYILTIFILLLISVFLTTELFPYKFLPELFLYIQFPYRCALFVSFFAALYSVYYLNYFKEKTTIIKVFILLSIIIILPCINVLEFFDKDIISYDINSPLGWSGEYLPINAKKNNKYKNKENKIISLNNNKVNIKEIENKTPNLIAKISNVKKTTTIEIPRLYYLGYNIKYKTKTKTYKLKYKIDKYGFIKVNIKESGTIYIKYTGTILYNIFRLIRLLFIIILIIYLIKNKKIKELSNENNKQI